MKHLFFLVPALLLGWAASAQKGMETDRPSQGEASSIVSKKWLQFEAGNQREKADDQLPSWLAPTYTFSPHFEMGHKWHAFVEAFGFIRKVEMPDHNTDPGVACNLSGNVRPDLSAGQGLSRQSHKTLCRARFFFPHARQQTKAMAGTWFLFFLIIEGQNRYA